MSAPWRSVVEFYSCRITFTSASSRQRALAPSPRAVFVARTPVAHARAREDREGRRARARVSSRRVGARARARERAPLGARRRPRRKNFRVRLLFRAGARDVVDVALARATRRAVGRRLPAAGSAERRPRERRREVDRAEVRASFEIHATCLFLQSSHHAAFAFVRLRRLIASSSRPARRQEPPGRDRRVRRDRRGCRRRRDRVHGDGPVLRRDREAPHRGRDQAGAFSSSPMRTFFTRPVGSTFDRVPFQLTDECTFASIHPKHRFSPTRRSTFETAWKSPSSWLECASARISSR